MHHANAGRYRIAWRAEANRSPSNRNCPRIGPKNSVHDAHERGFSSSIFAKEGMDRPMMDGESRTVERSRSTEALHNVCELECTSDSDGAHSDRFRVLLARR
jgi:hypothetical protein